MPFNFTSSIPGLLFLMSVGLLAIILFFPSWSLFYHKKHQTMVFANPWIICVRKQCNFIKEIGLSEATRVSLAVSLALSLPLGLSLPAQCSGLLSAPLNVLFPIFTSLICLSVGITELLSVVFFRLMLSQFKFLLSDFQLQLKWPFYVILTLSLVYIAAGSFIFYHRTNSSSSLILPSVKQSTSLNEEVPESSQVSLDLKTSEFPKISQTKTPAYLQTAETSSAFNPKKLSLKPLASEMPWKFQHHKMTSNITNIPWVSEKSLISQSPKPSSPLLNLEVLGFTNPSTPSERPNPQSSTSRLIDSVSRISETPSPSPSPLGITLLLDRKNIDF